MRLGFSDDDLDHAIDLGLPSPGSAFVFDPEIKVEAMWTGGVLGRSNLFAERRGPMVCVRRTTIGERRTGLENLYPFDSLVTHSSDRDDGWKCSSCASAFARISTEVRDSSGAPWAFAQVATHLRCAYLVRWRRSTLPIAHFCGVVVVRELFDDDYPACSKPVRAIAEASGEPCVLRDYAAFHMLARRLPSPDRFVNGLYQLFEAALRYGEYPKPRYTAGPENWPAGDPID